jgi:hypothetical protein
MEKNYTDIEYELIWNKDRLPYEEKIIAAAYSKAEELGLTYNQVLEAVEALCPPEEELGAILATSSEKVEWPRCLPVTAKILSYPSELSALVCTKLLLKRNKAGGLAMAAMERMHEVEKGKLSYPGNPAEDITKAPEVLARFFVLMPRLRVARALWIRMPEEMRVMVGESLSNIDPDLLSAVVGSLTRQKYGWPNIGM